MKRIKLMMFTLLLMLTATTAQAANTNEEFYLGQWTVSMKGLPQGDADMDMQLSRNDEGQLNGSLTLGEQKVSFERVSISETGGDLTVYFTSMGYQVYLTLHKTDDDNQLRGSMMGMFNATAKRITDNTNN